MYCTKEYLKALSRLVFKSMHEETYRCARAHIEHHFFNRNMADCCVSAPVRSLDLVCECGTGLVRAGCKDSRWHISDV